MADTKASAFPVVGTVVAGDGFPVVVASGPSNGLATWTVVFAPHLADANPHPQYLTPAEADLLYDALGVAAVVAGDLTTHEADTTNVHGFANTSVIPSIGLVSALPWINLR
jgi:hypothetical protein